MTGKQNKPICLFGAGGHGRGIAAQITRRTGRKPVFADEALAPGTTVAGVDVLFATLEDITDHELIVTIGSNATRRTIQHRAENLGISLTSFIADPNCYFSPPPGNGTVVLSGAVVNSETTLGAGIIVNNGSVVEHGCAIAPFTHIAPGAVIAGNVTLGAEVWIGANATVLQGCTITDHVTIGAGAVVTTDIMTPGAYVGQPARRLMSHASGKQTPETAP